MPVSRPRKVFRGALQPSLGVPLALHDRQTYILCPLNTCTIVTLLLITFSTWHSALFFPLSI